MIIKLIIADTLINIHFDVAYGYTDSDTIDQGGPILVQPSLLHSPDYLDQVCSVNLQIYFCLHPLHPQMSRVIQKVEKSKVGKQAGW